MRRALSSTDHRELLRAERDVEARLAEVGIDVDLDFASMAAVANIFRVASTARSHLERTVLARSEEHTSELQSRQYLVCRLLLEKKKKKTYKHFLHKLLKKK